MPVWVNSVSNQSAYNPPVLVKKIVRSNESDSSTCTPLHLEVVIGEMREQMACTPCNVPANTSCSLELSPGN